MRTIDFYLVPLVLKLLGQRWFLSHQSSWRWSSWTFLAQVDRLICRNSHITLFDFSLVLPIVVGVVHNQIS